jgi:hypothetical protein
MASLLPQAFGVAVAERSIFAHVCSVERVEAGTGRFGLGFLRRNEVTVKVVWGGRNVGAVKRTKAALGSTGKQAPSGLTADWRLDPTNPNSPSSERFLLPIGIAALRPKVVRLKRHASGSSSSDQDEHGSGSGSEDSASSSSDDGVSDDEGSTERGGAPATAVSDASPRVFGSSGSSKSRGMRPRLKSPSTQGGAPGDAMSDGGETDEGGAGGHAGGDQRRAEVVHPATNESAFDNEGDAQQSWGDDEEDASQDGKEEAESAAFELEVKASNAADDLHLMLECFVDGVFAGQVTLPPRSATAP